MHAADASEETTTDLGSLQAQLPDVVENAVVTGPVNPAEARALRLADLRAEWEQPLRRSFVPVEQAQVGSARVLLHGHRRVDKYPWCPRCLPVQFVNGRGSGHCKKRRRLESCTTSDHVAGRCTTDLESAPDPATLPADPMPPLGSVVVTAPAPFIGCANITGVHDGCPTPGTVGILGSGVRVEVATSFCEQHRYKLKCAEDTLTRTPFFPFGYCLCGVRYEGGGMAFEPCSSEVLDWSGPDPERGNVDARFTSSSRESGGVDAWEVPVRVFVEGGVVRSEFAVKEVADPLIYGPFQHEFETRPGSVVVQFSIYQAFAASQAAAVSPLEAGHAAHSY